MNIFVTGGAGFIGSQFIRSWVDQFPQTSVINFDRLTYAGNLANLEPIADHPSYRFIKGDICDSAALLDAIPHGGDAIVHFAAESHVDRSITGARDFVLTNVLGTQLLLDAAREKKVKRFLHISTVEVGGSMQPDEWLNEDSPLNPRSPYAASKAAAEHLVRAAGATFGMDYVITRTSNNYGPYQFPEKLIPLAICNALEDRSIPVYGDGLQVRVWVHVEDNCQALMDVLLRGRAGQTYHIGGGDPRNNLDALRTVLMILGKPRSLLRHVADRLGHDRRYQVDFGKIQRELGWQPRIPFVDGMVQTVNWYIENAAWCAEVRNGEYRRHYERQYGTAFALHCESEPCIIL